MTSFTELAPCYHGTYRPQKPGVLQGATSYQQTRCTICSMHARLQLRHQAYSRGKQQVRCTITVTRLQQRRGRQCVSHSTPSEIIHTIHHPRMPFPSGRSTIDNRRTSPQLPTNTAGTTEQMGNHLPAHSDRWSPLVWRQTSHHGRLLLKKGGNFTISRLNNGRAPRNFKHNMGNRKGLLVASHEEGCHPIRQRMYHMPI